MQDCHGKGRIQQEGIFSPANWTAKKKPVKFYILSMALYGAESGTLRTVDQ
jgi:hypothetical protein